MNETTAATDELKRALSAEEGGRKWLRRLGILAVFAAVISGGLIYASKNKPAPPPRFMNATVAVGDVVEKIQATGTVQPMLQVSVGAQVNGRVTNVLVDFNSMVKKGEVLAEIDSTIYGSQVSANQANLAMQRAQLESVKAQQETARINFERVQRLYEQNLASKGELDAVRGQFDVAQANARASAASIGATQAQLTQSLTNVSFTKIYSPVDGIVISRGVDPGATVVASFQAPVLFVIAQDLRKMRVLADVDEADVGEIKENMPADAVVDAFPGESFKGTVKQIRYSPNNVQGVVTYSAVVEVENPDEKLRPGMTATITIKTREAKNVTRVPNAALRFKPPQPLGPDGKPLPAPPENPLAKGEGRVYVYASDKPGEEKEEAKSIAVGVTDGMFTEVLNGSLEVGTKIITDATDADEKKKRGGKMF